MTICISEYILPICLPFEWNYVMKDITGQKLIVSGWGKTDPSKITFNTFSKCFIIRINSEVLI